VNGKSLHRAQGGRCQTNVNVRRFRLGQIQVLNLGKSRDPNA